MASYTILDAPQPTGFLAGVNQGAGTMGTLYADALLKKKQKEVKEQDAMKKFSAVEAMAQKYGLDPEISWDSTGGIKFAWKPKKDKKSNTFSSHAIKEAMAGILDPKPYADIAGVKLQEPAMSLPSGNMGDVYGAPIEDKSNQIQEALMEKFAPGVSKEDISRSVMGLSKSGKSKTEDYSNDLKRAVNKEISFDDVIVKHPTKVAEIQKIKDVYTPLNKTTIKVIHNIKTEEDYKELTDNEELYKAEGVNVEAIKEYFNTHKIDNGNWFQKIFNQ